MPCDSIVYNSINFEQAKNHLDLLVEALRNLGYSVRQQGDRIRFESKDGLLGSYANGIFTTNSYNGESLDVDRVKQEFGKAAVKKVCKKFGWSVAEKSGKFQIRKRA